MSRKHSDKDDHDEFKKYLSELYKRTKKKELEPIYDGLREAAFKGEYEVSFYGDEATLAKKVSMMEGLKHKFIDADRDGDAICVVSGWSNDGD